MLKQLEAEGEERLQKSLSASPAFGVRLSSLLRAYGTGRPFFNVWHQDYDTALARLEGSFFVFAGASPDCEEIALFCNLNPLFCRLTGEAGAVESIVPFISGDTELCRCLFMGLKGKFKLGMGFSGGTVDSSPDLRAVYSVMAASRGKDFDPGEFAPWYADISHRIRHGCARAYLLKSDGEAVSALLVSAESDGAGLISGVATAPEFRNKGGAGEVLARACRDLTLAGKLPVLECLPVVSGFYAKMGFEKLGEVLTAGLKNGR